MVANNELEGAQSQVNFRGSLDWPLPFLEIFKGSCGLSLGTCKSNLNSIKLVLVFEGGQPFAHKHTHTSNKSRAVAGKPREAVKISICKASAELH